MFRSTVAHDVDTNALANVEIPAFSAVTLLPCVHVDADRVLLLKPYVETLSMLNADM